MRVLHFLPVYLPAWQFGGPVLSVSRLCEGLVSRGVDIRVITTNAGLSTFPQQELGIPQNVNGVNVTYYPTDNNSAVIRSKALEDSLNDHMLWADLLHLSSIWQPLGIPVQSAAYRHNIPVIQTLRGALGPYSWSRSFYKKIPYYLLKEMPYLQRVASIHCTTQQEASELKWLRLKPPTALIPNPLDLSTSYLDDGLRLKWRLDHNISLSDPVFLIAGRLHHKKGLELLPAVLSSIKEQSWRLVIIGDDSDGTGRTFRKSLERLGLMGRCLWFDLLPSAELVGPLNAADWLLLPSRHENFGNICVEALSCGCGVVLSDRVGCKDLLSGCPGVITGPRTTATWSKLIQQALSLPRPGPASKSWVTSKFSQDNVASQVLSLYVSILQDE